MTTPDPLPSSLPTPTCPERVLGMDFVWKSQTKAAPPAEKLEEKL